MRFAQSLEQLLRVAGSGLDAASGCGLGDLVLNSRSSTAASTLRVTDPPVFRGYCSPIVNAGRAVSYLCETIDRAARQARAHEGDAGQLHAFPGPGARGSCWRCSYFSWRRG